MRRWFDNQAEFRRLYEAYVNSQQLGNDETQEALKIASTMTTDTRAARPLARYLSHPDRDSDVIALIPHADPLLSVEIPGDTSNSGRAAERRLSLLNDDRSERYQRFIPYWRRQIEEWLAHRPVPESVTLKPTGPVMEIDVIAAGSGKSEDRSALQSALTYLKNRRDRKQVCERHQAAAVAHAQSNWGLTAVQGRDLLTYLHTGYDRELDPATLRKLVPEVARQMDQSAAESLAALDRWGLRQRYISPATGQLYELVVDTYGDNNRQAGHDPTIERVLSPVGDRWPDASTRYVGLHQSWPIGQPILMHYQVALVGKARTRVVVEYDTEIGFDAQQRFLEQFYPPVFSYVLSTHQYWKQFGPITIRVTAVGDLIPVMSPVPDSIKYRDGQWECVTTVNRPKENLAVALCPLDWAGSWHQSMWNSLPTDRAEAELRALLDHAEHPTARVLVRTRLAALHMAQWRWWLAHQEMTALRKDHPDYPWPDIPDQVRQTADWIRATAAVPRFDSDDDFRRLHTLSDADLAVLVQNLKWPASHDESDFVTLACWFVQLESGHGQLRGVAPYMAAPGRKSARVAREVLRLWSHATADLTGGLDFMVDCLAPEEMLNAADTPATTRPTVSDTKAELAMVRSAAIECLRRYCAVRTEPPPTPAPNVYDIVNWPPPPPVRSPRIGRGDPPAMLIDRIESMLAGSLDPAARQALHELMVVIAPRRAVPLLHAATQPGRPDRSRAMVALARLGDRSTLPWAIETYNSAAAGDARRDAQQVLLLLADAAVLPSLRCRQDVTDADDASVPLRILASLGAAGLKEQKARDDLLALAERIVAQHFKTEADIQRVPVVEALRRLGDPRGIPVLEKLLLIPRDHRPIAWAIGDLRLGLVDP